MGDPDLSLVLRVIADDDRYAFGELVKRHQSGVRNHLRTLTRGDHARTDDLAQETFVRAYRSIRQYRGEAKFSSWLYRIAYRIFLNDERSAKRRRIRNEAESDAEARWDEPAGDSGRRSHDLAVDFHTALEGMEPERAAVFDLHYRKGMSHGEVGQTLQMPLGTVKTHLARGLKSVRETLKDWKERR